MSMGTMRSPRAKRGKGFVRIGRYRIQSQNLKMGVALIVLFMIYTLMLLSGVSFLPKQSGAPAQVQVSIVEKRYTDIELNHTVILQDEDRVSGFNDQIGRELALYLLSALLYNY